MKRETKIGYAALIAAITSIIAIMVIISGMATNEEEKIWSMIVLQISLTTFTYCLILDRHKPDPHWKVKLSGTISCFTAGFLMIISYEDMSIDLMMRIFIFSCVIFVVYYVFLYVMEKANNYKMRLLEWN